MQVDSAKSVTSYLDAVDVWRRGLEINPTTRKPGRDDVTLPVEESLEAKCATVHRECEREAADVLAPGDGDDSHHTTQLRIPREPHISLNEGNWAFYPVMEETPPSANHIMSDLLEE